VPNLLMLASGVGSSRNRRSLGKGGGRADTASSLVLSRFAVTLSLFSVVAWARDPIAPLLSPGSCGRSLFSFVHTIVSRVTGAAAGRTFSLAAGDRLASTPRG